jgi:hypothetical protein
MALQPTSAVATDGRIYTNTVGGYFIEVYGPSGELDHRIVGDVGRIPVTDAETLDRVREMADAAEARGNSSRAQAWREHGEWLGAADFRPVIGDMFASRGGRILIRRLDIESTTPGSSSVWDLLDVEEGFVGRAILASELHVGHFEWPYLYVTMGPPEDREVVRFRLVVG